MNSLNFYPLSSSAVEYRPDKKNRRFASLILSGSLVFGLFAPSAQAALTFTFNYLNQGEGFDDPVLGPSRKAALNSAAEMLGSYFRNYTATLTYDISSYSVNNSTLASTSTGIYVEPGSFQQSFVQTKILSNGLTDNNGADADGSMEWNFFDSWGLDNVNDQQYDFKNVAIHELLHTFGFSSVIGNGGTGLDGATPGTPETWTTFDNFLTDASGARLIDPSGVFDSARIAALTGGSGSVLFNGPNAVAANGGAGVSIFSPEIWDEGSSLTHLDDDNPALADMVMTAYTDQGPAGLALSAIELGILMDIGYTDIVVPSEVPVPAAIWFMASGMLAVLGFPRRKSVAANR